MTKRTFRNIALSALVTLACGMGAYPISRYLTNGEKAKTEFSNIVHEDAVVDKLIYEEPIDGGPINPRSRNWSAVPANYGFVLRGKRGGFMSVGSSAKHKDWYDRLREGQEVDVTYGERPITIKTADGKGEDAKSYEVIDVQPKAKGQAEKIEW